MNMALKLIIKKEENKHCYNNIGFKAQLSTKKGSDLCISAAFIISAAYQGAGSIEF